VIEHLHAAPTPPARVVILGASGFVGRALSDHLATLGVETVGLSSREVDLLDAGSVFRLLGTLQRDDALVFASAITPDRGKDVRALMRNLTMGEHVAAALERTPCAQVIYLSSDAVYDDVPGLLRETTPCAPPSLYGLMHVTREKMVGLATQKTGTPLLVVRPCAIYGTGDTHNSYGPNRFLRSALGDGVIRLFGNGEEKRDHVAVSDFSRLLGLALAHRSTGTLNVASGKAVSFAEVADLIRELCSRTVKIECQARATPITHRHFDVSELVRAFPAFGMMPLRDGLHAMCSELLYEPARDEREAVERSSAG
jgi:nucleoside-diphosphate-sugar epimerase